MFNPLAQTYLLLKCNFSANLLILASFLTLLSLDFAFYKIKINVYVLKLL